VHVAVKALFGEASDQQSGGEARRHSDGTGARTFMIASNGGAASGAGLML